jgi:hypothetical protein
VPNNLYRLQNRYEWPSGTGIDDRFSTSACFSFTCFLLFSDLPTRAGHKYLTYLALAEKFYLRSPLIRKQESLHHVAVSVVGGKMNIWPTSADLNSCIVFLRPIAQQ